jgi:capsular exopolysaccharide synthesis family protein
MIAPKLRRVEPTEGRRDTFPGAGKTIPRSRTPDLRTAWRNEIVTSGKHAPMAEQRYLDLTDYLDILRRRKAWILVSIAIMVLLGAAHFLLAPKAYVSTARVLVEEINVDPVEAGNPVDLETEREVVLSTGVARIAKESMGSEESPAALLGHVSVEVAGETQVLTISYTAGTPSQAQSGAGAFADGYLEYRTQRARQASASVRENIESSIVDLQARVAELTQAIADTAQGTDERALALATRSGLQAQIAEHRLQLADLTGVHTTPGAVIGAPTAPEAPASPSLPIDLGLGLVAGSIIGAVLALFRERTDPNIRGQLDLEETLGVPALGTVPPVPEWKDAEAPMIITKDAPYDPATEGYRLLRTHLLLAADSAGGEPQVAMVTSALPGEGKTSTVANLGVALAHSGKKTILVSADFRRPRLHQFFELPNHPGLSDIRTGRVSVADALRPTGIENLVLLSTGDTLPGEVELLQPQYLRELAQACLDSDDGFDFMIVDSPPILPVADSLAMMPAIDQVIFVVDAGKTEHAALRRCRMLLENVEAEVLGGILNNWKPPRSDRYEAYGYGYGPMEGPAPTWGRRLRSAVRLAERGGEGAEPPSESGNGSPARGRGEPNEKQRRKGRRR